MTKQAYVHPHTTIIQVEAEYLMATSPGQISTQSDSGDNIFNNITETEQGGSYSPW